MTCKKAIRNIMNTQMWICVKRKVNRYNDPHLAILIDKNNEVIHKTEKCSKFCDAIT